MLAIVIPAYNREDCLREALRSLTCQTSKDFSVLVVDDHSPNPVRSVVAEFGDILDAYYIYAEENGGPGAARQIGLTWCTEQGYDYIMFLDSDDRLMPQAVERLVHEIENTGCDFISSAIWQDHGGHMGAKIEATNQTWLHGKIFRISYLAEKGFAFPPIRTNEDVTFNLLATECAGKKGHLDEVLYYFTWQPNSITRSEDSPTNMISTDYILAIYYTAVKMEEVLGGITRQVLIDILALYNFYQVGKQEGLITDDLVDKIRYMLNIPAVRAALETPTQLEGFINIPNPFYLHREKLYKFDQTFFEWIEELQ